MHLDMGKYAVYVWPAYGVSAVVLIAMVWDSLSRAARWRKAAEAAEPPAKEAP
jgi:heme exporter protein D